MISEILPGVWGIDGDSHHRHWIISAGRLDHDQSTLPLLKQYIPKGGVVVDGGAHVGSHSIFYADLVGPEGTVISFEPGPDAFRCLQRNCPASITYQLALSKSYGLSWLRHDQNYGGAHLGNDDNGAEPVFIVPLDALELKRLDFLKLDVEGCEIRALIGAESTIERCRPIMLIEVNEGALARQGASPDALYNQIKSFGYRYDYLFPEHHANMPQTDVICFPI